MKYLVSYQEIKIFSVKENDSFLTWSHDEKG